MPKPTDLLISSDAAKLLDCSPDNVRRLVREKVLIPAHVTAGPRKVSLFTRAQVEALAAKRKAARAASV